MLSAAIRSARADLLSAVRAEVGAVDEGHGEKGGYVQVADLAMRVAGVFGMCHAGRIELPLTGWQLDPAFIPFDDDRVYGIYHVDELAARRPVWVVPLVLPAGWSFYCDGNTLIDVLAPDRTVVPIGRTVCAR